MVDSCDSKDKALIAIKCSGFLEQLRDYQLNQIILLHGVIDLFFLGSLTSLYQLQGYKTLNKITRLLFVMNGKKAFVTYFKIVPTISENWHYSRTSIQIPLIRINAI
jgi:hypothetical protein